MINRGNVLNVRANTREDTKTNSKRYSCEVEPAIKVPLFVKQD